GSSTARPTLLSLPPRRGRPSVSDLIFQAVCLSSARRGTSLAVLKKTLAAQGYDVRRNSGRLKAALNSLLHKGLLERVRGSGVAGSFRIGPVGKERLDKYTRRGRAAGGARRRRLARKKKEPRRAGKATAQRLKKPSRPRGRAKAVPVAQNRAENAAGVAEVAVAEVPMEGAAEVPMEGAAEVPMEGATGVPEAPADC
uniref:H15 domain-containing protein n=1 Tax=Amazona collaria TaxID=241587 RepID=A0A8B9FT82_9PSIT